MNYSGLLGTAKIVVVILLAASVNAQAQKLYQISLSDFKIDPHDIHLTVSEIIDARRDKNSLGIIQTGLSNRRNFAVFEKPGLTEIEELLKNSGLHSVDHGLTMRVTSLKISENALTWKETAKAELNIDFFLRHKDLYYYVNSVFTSAEPKGLDVTGKQAENIVDVIAKALIIFSQHKNEVSPDQSFTKEELEDPSLSLRDPASMPVMTSQKFKDGYYATFEEFVNNTPSIDLECRIRFSSPVKTICGEQETEVPTLFGFARENKLYILYHHQFFELEKRNDTFFFNGDPRLSKNAADDFDGSLFTADMFTDAIVSRPGDYSTIYMLDIKTGTVKSISGL